MAGPALNPVPVLGLDSAGVHSTPTASDVNSFRIATVSDRLAMHFRIGSTNDSTEFFNLCLSLARGIDYAVANNEIPGRASDLPLLLKQVCQRKNAPLLQAAVMVLMISVKNACKNGWFSDKDEKDLFNLLHEIGSSFCSVKEINTEKSSFLPVISTIMLRYYPRLTMGHILTFLEAKPGYGAFVTDFRISKDAKDSGEKIRLLVVQTDNIETSSCIVSPPQANFLLNGKGVERRTNVFVDSGPQFPTSVSHMLKYGTNLLQAVGQFNGTYIIVVAFMNTISTLSHHDLPDYVQLSVAALDSDNEIIEGPSRISLNCPISLRRISTPVKGHLCKHIQCFDFDNYVYINSRKPSWRCPRCNQCVSFNDLRIDQNMAKVLKEVGEDVTDVIFSVDGSWKRVTDSDNRTDISHDKPLNGTGHQEFSKNALPEIEILDLVDEDSEMDTIDTRQNEDIKPSNPQNVSGNLGSNSTREVREIAPLPLEDDFWSGIYLASQGVGISESTSVDQILGGMEVSGTSIFTDAISTTPTNMHLQPYGNSNIDHEYERNSIVSRNVGSRTHVAVQAFPSIAPAGVPSNVERHHPFSRSQLNPVQSSSPITVSAVPQLLDVQNWCSQDPLSVSSQPAQQPTIHPSLNQGAHPLQSFNQRNALSSTQPPGLVRPSAAQLTPHIPRTQARHGGPQSGVGALSGQQSRFLSAAHRSIQMGRPLPSMPHPSQIHTSRSSHPVAIESNVARDQRGNVGSIAEAVAVDPSAERNWQPAGRMRGSLSGRAYSEAYSQYMIQPTQPIQAARPPVLNIASSLQAPLSPQLQVLMANRQAFEGNAAGTSGALPAQSSTMQ